MKIFSVYVSTQFGVSAVHAEATILSTSSLSLALFVSLVSCTSSLQVRPLQLFNMVATFCTSLTPVQAWPGWKPAWLPACSPNYLADLSGVGGKGGGGGGSADQASEGNQRFLCQPGGCPDFT